MPAYKKMESLENGGSWGKFWWKTCGFEWDGNIHIYGETEVILFLLVHLIVWHLDNAQVNF